jgi:membrane carboxypeptidase/penicillin-binding protein
VLKNVPDKTFATPEGVVQLRINADSGLRDDNGTLQEWFFSEYVPRRDESSLALPQAPGGRPAQDVRNQIF